MKRLFYALLLTIMSAFTSASASGISKMYVQRNAGDECVFFIFSQKLPAIKKLKSTPKQISYDYTYVQSTDSVSMLITINLNAPKKLDNVTISANNVLVSSIPKIVYVKAVGSKMQYRLRITMSFSEFDQIYNSATPFTFELMYNDLDGKTDAIFGYSDKSWIDKSRKMRSIIELIKLNTGKK